MSDLYGAIKRIVEQDIASEREACEFLEVSRSAFQRWEVEPISIGVKSDMELIPIITGIFHRHRRRYGARRIVADLKHQGIQCGRSRVAKLLQIAGLSAIQPKSFKPRTTESRHTLGYNENLLLNHAEPIAINELWVGDITYIPIARQGFCYLATLLDRYSRRIVGWALDKDMTESLVTKALRQAIRARQPKPSMIHHTDRGGQYASTRYREILNRAGMRQSMSRAGDCYDNAFMESCFGTIKTELQMTEYESYEDSLATLTEFIDYYNISRLHSSLGYLTPSQFENNVPY